MFGYTCGYLEQRNVVPPRVCGVVIFVNDDIRNRVLGTEFGEVDRTCYNFDAVRGSPVRKKDTKIVTVYNKFFLLEDYEVRNYCLLVQH